MRTKAHRSEAQNPRPESQKKFETRKSKAQRTPDLGLLDSAAPDERPSRAGGRSVKFVCINFINFVWGDVLFCCSVVVVLCLCALPWSNCRRQTTLHGQGMMPFFKVNVLSERVRGGGSAVQSARRHGKVRRRHRVKPEERRSLLPRRDCVAESCLAERTGFSICLNFRPPRRVPPLCDTAEPNSEIRPRLNDSPGTVAKKCPHIIASRFIWTWVPY